MDEIKGHGKFDASGKLILPNPFETMFREALKMNLKTEGGRNGLQALGISVEKAKTLLNEED